MIIYRKVFVKDYFNECLSVFRENLPVSKENIFIDEIKKVWMIFIQAFSKVFKIEIAVWFKPFFKCYCGALGPMHPAGRHQPG